MSKYESSAIRNLAFVGHGGTGKTTFAEVILKEVGLISRVPAGVMDYASDEKEKQISIDSAIAHITWKDKEINLIDCPGYQEFFHNAISALNVVETAVIFISAADGLTVNTRRAWSVAKQNHLAKIIVLTKADGENVNFDERIDQIQSQFGKHCIPFIVPDGVSSQFTRVKKVLDANEKGVAEYKNKLVEATVETNDELLNKYLEGEEIAADILEVQLKKAIKQGEIIPIVTVCPVKEIGTKEFLEVVSEFAPSPLEVAPKKPKNIQTKEEMSLEVSEKGPFSGQIFRIFNDPFGRITYFRVYTGSLASASTIYDVNIESSERIGAVSQIIGKDLKAIDRAIPGDIVAIAKVENIQIGHTLANEKANFVYDMPEYPMPMVSLAVAPKARGDEQKITSSLAKLAEEDKTFRIKRDEETNELIVSGMSNLHLEIVLARLKNRFKVECTQKLPKIPYRETIVGKADKRYRHKKQSGGHGQFGEVAIKLEPAERGKGFDFVDQIVGGVVPSQFVASTQKGVQGAMVKGIIAGYPVVDVRVILYDGKTHEVDSSDAAFQMAGSKAFQEGFVEAKPVLLEPVVNIEITVPAKYMGDIMGDLNSRRGRIAGSDSDGNYQIIKALVPLAEIATYSTELKSITGGEGSYYMEFSHYDVVPGNVQEKIVARAKQEQEKKDK